MVVTWTIQHAAAQIDSWHLQIEFLIVVVIVAAVELLEFDCLSILVLQLVVTVCVDMWMDLIVCHALVSLTVRWLL